MLHYMCVHLQRGGPKASCRVTPNGKIVLSCTDLGANVRLLCKISAKMLFGTPWFPNVIAVIIITDPTVYLCL